jgi:predicted ATPase
MSTPQIRIKTEHFRAISEADIVIDGITVVAGENGCGKSTLSKLLYFFYKTASNYNSLVSRELKFRLKDIERFLDIILSEIHAVSHERNTREEFEELRNLRRSLDDLQEEDMIKWVSFVQKIENNYYSQPSLFKEKLPLNSRISNRLKFIVRDILKINDENSNYDNTNILPFDKVIKLIEDRFLEAFDKIKLRPTSLFVQALEGVFADSELPGKFEVFEFEEQIVSIKKETLSIPYIVQNVIYIDTPIAVGVENSDIEYWDDLNELLHRKGKLSFSSLSNVISEEVIEGDVSLDDKSLTLSDFSYKRSDGSIFNLLDVATGVKSFAILQLLIKNGSLSDKTLLIMDEPESHLHPQWIIEYARLIVLLNKELGVKFFIASHNPDMISALKYISEKEGLESKLNFYLAEKSGSAFLFDYKHLGTNIDPIFKSFNIAMDRIMKYGS